MSKIKLTNDVSVDAQSLGIAKDVNNLIASMQKTTSYTATQACYVTVSVKAHPTDHVCFIRCDGKNMFYAGFGTGAGYLMGSFIVKAGQVVTTQGDTSVVSDIVVWGLK